MTASNGLALHESLEVHELLSFKNVCLTKSKTMQGLVTDENLKSLLQQDVQQSVQHIKGLQGILNKLQ